MTEKHTQNDPATMTPDEARGARPVKGMPYVLGISLAAVVILGILAAVVLM